MARRYWVIAPYRSKRLQIFNKVWEYDKKNGTLAIGWRKLGNVSNLSQSELKSKYEQTYGGRPSDISYGTNVIWSFYHEIEVGDVVIARRGLKRIIGIGAVTKNAFYDEERGIERVVRSTNHFYPNFIGVEWGEVMDIEFDRSIVRSQHTIKEFTEVEYKSLLEEISSLKSTWGLDLRHIHNLAENDTFFHAFSTGLSARHSNPLLFDWRN